MGDLVAEGLELADEIADPEGGAGVAAVPVGAGTGGGSDELGERGFETPSAVFWSLASRAL
ncbi:hypothetical protein [Streptomyces sp. NBC_01451]|uniref:hypothetical protein n=1 Tax=Streptomyces sp. NBC_01451 TaxID=2903872 RepID=UPI002E320751|nr:hypothetical protein [Streptomyces sp. NBC_01451]